MCVKRTLLLGRTYAFTLFFQIYTGSNKDPKQRAAAIELDADNLANIQEGCLVAMYFDNWNKDPVIGEVFDVEDEHFLVHYWKGTYNVKWSPQQIHMKRSEPWLERLPKTFLLSSPTR